VHVVVCESANVYMCEGVGYQLTPQDIKDWEDEGE